MNNNSTLTDWIDSNKNIASTEQRNIWIINQIKKFIHNKKSFNLEMKK